MATKSSSSTNLAEARRTANLRVLQRLDPQIVDLAITASHVVLYQFSLETQQWIKRNVEGSLFVVKRSDVPRFKLIVSNRNSTENLEVGITSTFQMQLREPYLIFRDSASSNNNSSGGAATAADEAIRGLWFHDGKEREQVHSYLENVVKSLQKIDEMEKEHGPPPSLMTNTTDNGSNDTSSSSNAASAGEKKKGPVEVNTNAAGAALLSTLNLNDNKQQTTTTAAKSRKQTPQPLQPTTQSSNATPSSSTSPPPAAAGNTLDKKSLQLALLSLIQDERFLDLIHAQYLKVASSRAQREQQQQQQQNNSGQGDDK